MPAKPSSGKGFLGPEELDGDALALVEAVDAFDGLVCVDARLGQLVGSGVSADSVGRRDGEDFVHAFVDLGDLGHATFLVDPAPQSVGVEHGAAGVGDVVRRVGDTAAVQLVTVAWLGELVVGGAAHDRSLQDRQRVIVDGGSQRAWAVDVDVRGDDVTSGDRGCTVCIDHRCHLRLVDV